MKSSVRALVVSVFASFASLLALSTSASGSDTPPPPPVAPSPAVTTKSCGEGVCRRTVSSSALTCVPGQPVTADDGWLYKPDPTTGSWDANCDGKVEKRSTSELNEFASNCEMLRGVCRSHPKREYACGEKATFWQKCVATTKNGVTTCSGGGGLQGELVQGCR